MNRITKSNSVTLLTELLQWEFVEWERGAGGAHDRLRIVWPAQRLHCGACASVQASIQCRARSICIDGVSDSPYQHPLSVKSYTGDT